MLPTLSDLCYFCLNDTLHKHDELLSALPLSKIRTLLVRDLSYDLMSIYETISITNLTLFDCSFNDLCQILKYVPMLKYLNAGCMDSDVKDDKFLKTALCLANNQALLLIKLIIRISSITFVDFEMLLKQTPNLSTLILSSSSRHLINAYDWEHFISILLPHLNHFEFKFYIRLIEKDDTDRTIDELFHIFKQFQTDFWHNQHHWYTEYYVHKDMAIIYTIPYISQYFTLTPDRNKHCNILVNNSQSFERVTKLTLSSSALTNNCRHYFSNVQSLHLVNYNSRSINDLCALNPEDIQSIKNIINLSSLKHLDIEDHYSINLSLVLLEMLKQAPQLSSITMRTSSVTLLFDNDQLCQYLNKMIKKLNIKKLAYFYPYIHSNQIEKFCTIFSNIEQLECSIDQLDHLLLLLSHLSKLSNITVNSSCFPDDINLWLHDKTMELKRNYLFEYTEEIFSPENKTLNIWIGENIN
ncbi:unnamed protein product [Rotaria sp. Silwood1]|nr:unnamed protein product [Rotaria sp. Silwood1]